MKLIITTILASLALQSASAQDLSVGIRTGLGKTLQLSNLRDGSIHKTWDKELFLRYEIKGRWAFEITGTQYYNNYHITPLDFEYFAPPTSETLDIYSKSNNVDFAVSAQYDISCNYLKEHCPLMKNLRSFIGVNVGVGYRRTTEIYTQKQYADGMVTKENYKYQSLTSPQVGLSHTLTYSLGKVFITSSTTMMLLPFSNQTNWMYQDNYYNSKLSLRIGVGYTL